MQATPNWDSDHIPRVPKSPPLPKEIKLLPSVFANRCSIAIGSESPSLRSTLVLPVPAQAFEFRWHASLLARDAGFTLR
jgi:hypothetical protein